MPEAKFRVAICGGGIGGLTLAAALGKYSQDIHVDIYEAASAFNHIGAGINLWRRTWRIMEILGLTESLQHLAIDPPTEEQKPGYVFRKSDIPEEGFDIFEMMVSYGPIGVHRADFLSVLTEALPKTTNTHFSKRLKTYEETASKMVILRFTDGTEAEADILVGSDGIKSAVRGAMYRAAAEAEDDMSKANFLLDHVEPIWTGNLAYRSTYETTKLTSVHPGHRVETTQLMYLGKNKHVVAYPISKGQLINLVCFVSNLGGEGTHFEGPAMQCVSKEEVVSHFKGWEPEVESLTECANEPVLWVINGVRDLPFYVKDRALLLGDAAHAMTTHIGAGAGQAIEDAYILGRILSHPKVNIENLEFALRIWESVRLPVASAVIKRSRTAGLLYEFNEKGYENTTNLCMDDINTLGNRINDQWRWQWETLPDDDWLSAEAKLEEGLS